MSGKRTIPVKVMLSEEEYATLQGQVVIHDTDAAEELRSGWLLSMFGTLGLARMRAKRYRGSDAELHPVDFQRSRFDPNSL